MNYYHVSALLGKTLKSITIIDGEHSNDQIIFELDTGEKFRMYGDPECVECVSIEDIAGDIEDLIGTPLLRVEEATNDYEDIRSWTFYKFATIKGSVDIRWYVVSSGHYSESVNFERIVN